MEIITSQKGGLKLIHDSYMCECSNRILFLCKAAMTTNLQTTTLSNNKFVQLCPGACQTPTQETRTQTRVIFIYCLKCVMDIHDDGTDSPNRMLVFMSDKWLRHLTSFTTWSVDRTLNVFRYSSLCIRGWVFCDMWCITIQYYYITTHSDYFKIYQRLLCHPKIIHILDWYWILKWLLLCLQLFANELIWVHRHSSATKVYCQLH